MNTITRYKTYEATIIIKNNKIVEWSFHIATNPKLKKQILKDTLNKHLNKNK